MSTSGDPLAGIIADAVAMAPRDIDYHHGTGFQSQSQEQETSEHFRSVTTEYAFEGSIKSAPVFYGGFVDGNKSGQDPFVSSPATPSYPKFDAGHSVYTFQSQADNYNEHKAVSPTWNGQIGLPRSPAVSNGLGFFTGIPQNVQDALADIKKQTGFVIIDKNFNKANNVFDSDKLKSSENYQVDGYRTPPLKSAFRSAASGEKKVRFTTSLATPTESGTGFTPLIKQAEQFAAECQVPVLESPTANRSALNEKRVARAQRAAAIPLPARAKKTVRKQKKKIDLYAFSEVQARYLLSNIPANSEYEVQIYLQTDGTFLPIGRNALTAGPPAAEASNLIAYGPTIPTVLNNIGDGNLDLVTSGSWAASSNQLYEWNDTFEDIAQLIHPEPGSPIGSSSSAPVAPRSPKIKLIIKPTQGYLFNNGPKEFTFFSKLPVELQLDIWNKALPGRRTVKLSVESTTSLKPFHTPIPAILHACQISREVALKILHPSFHSVANAKEYTFFNPQIDVLELSLPYAKAMATIHELSIKNSRDLTQHVRIPFKIYTGMPMWLAMAELTLAAPHKAWPAIKSWHFPGLQIDEDGNVENEEPVELRCVWLGVKRPATKEDSNTQSIVQALADKIKAKFDDGNKKYGTKGIQLGIRITYDS